MQRRLVLVGALVAFGFSAEAGAADIASVLGTPGTTAWETACVADYAVPGPLGYGVVDCASLPAVLQPLCMHRVDISPSEHPAAVCSDGTPASFYVRPGTTDPDRWIIHLQGGGGCTNEAECKRRWCGQDGLYTAAQMSTDWNADGVNDLPEHAGMFGISQPIPSNDFAGWTQVFVSYCSSDLWQGRASNVDMGAFSVDARGHKIVQAVRRMLRKLGDPWQTAGDYEIPDLDAATEVILSGTSAGGYGALQNADFFFEPLSARGGVVVDGAMDVTFYLDPVWNLWADDAGLPYDAHRTQLYMDRWAPGGYYAEINAFVDQTCSDFYAPDRLDRCVSPSLLLELAIGSGPIVETPVFVRMDLEDPVLSDWIVEPVNPDGESILIGGSGGVTPTMDDYAAMMRETLVRLAADPETNISVHAPKCGKHVGLELFAPFFSWTTPDTSDDPIPVNLGGNASAHDAIWEWFDPGGSFQRIRRIDTDEPGVWFSSCP